MFFIPSIHHSIDPQSLYSSERTRQSNTTPQTIGRNPSSLTALPWQRRHWRCAKNINSHVTERIRFCGRRSFCDCTTRDSVGRLIIPTALRRESRPEGRWTVGGGVLTGMALLSLSPTRQAGERRHGGKRGRERESVAGLSVEYRSIDLVRLICVNIHRNTGQRNFLYSPTSSLPC